MTKYKYQPDFDEILLVLNKKKPSRPVLFEFFLNPTVYALLAGRKQEDDTKDAYNRLIIDAFHAGGYDFATVHGSDFSFPIEQRHFQKTVSLNDGFVITDEKSFDEYKWPDAENFDYSQLEKLNSYKQDGMKLMVPGPCGVLENVIALVGYENLCYMLIDEPELAERVFTEVGTRLLKYYQLCVEYDSVGIIMVNDDWGFNTQTFLSPKDMRHYVFPWHKKIVELAHKYNKPAILHSCGYAGEVMEDIIEDIKFNARHSYEDVIQPVEDSYKQWGTRIGILGGIDIDFLIKSSTEDIHKRSAKMLDLAEEHGSYALGSGNSIPEYIPYEHYRAMTRAALERR
ncbi:MAG: hypothetical protein LBD23_04405 [Oscillospiraceae bacterium]|jgi:uroporphyrinogen decarboxylase|nr:hypothetical protein [Oscillospiraceae bacterium]